MLRNKTFAPEFCSLISNWFDMREQAPGANLLHESVSGASSLVCTEICLPWHDVSPVGQSNWLIFFIHNSLRTQSGCFIIQIRRLVLRVYWLGYLPGSVFQEQVPSCVPALIICLIGFYYGKKQFFFFHSKIDVVKHALNLTESGELNRGHKHETLNSRGESGSTLAYVMRLDCLKHVTSVTYYGKATCCFDSSFFFDHFLNFDFFQIDKGYIFPKLRSKVVFSWPAYCFLERKHD